MHDWVMPDFFTETAPRARKTHRCCECHKEIAVGERYQRVSGKWDGDVQSFKICEPCRRIREWADAYLRKELRDDA